MATIRFDAFSDETIVVHFGGPEGTIDAYTLANALIALRMPPAQLRRPVPEVTARSFENSISIRPIWASGLSQHPILFVNQLHQIHARDLHGVTDARNFCETGRAGLLGNDRVTVHLG